MQYRMSILCLIPLPGHIGCSTDFPCEHKYQDYLPVALMALFLCLPHSVHATNYPINGLLSCVTANICPINIELANLTAPHLQHTSYVVY